VESQGRRHPAQDQRRPSGARRRSGRKQLYLRDGTLAWCLGLGTAASAIIVGTAAAAPYAAALGGAVVGGAAGNFGHEVCKVLDRRVLGKLLEPRSGIAENHVVVQALRLAELKALG